MSAAKIKIKKSVNVRIKFGSILLFHENQFQCWITSLINNNPKYAKTKEPTL